MRQRGSRRSHPAFTPLDEYHDGNAVDGRPRPVHNPNRDTVRPPPLPQQCRVMGSSRGRSEAGRNIIRTWFSTRACPSLARRRLMASLYQTAPFRVKLHQTRYRRTFKQRTEQQRRMTTTTSRVPPSAQPKNLEHHNPLAVWTSHLEANMRSSSIRRGGSLEGHSSVHRRRSMRSGRPTNLRWSLHLTLNQKKSSLCPHHPSAGPIHSPSSNRRLLVSKDMSTAAWRTSATRRPISFCDRRLP